MVTLHDSFTNESNYLPILILVIKHHINTTIKFRSLVEKSDVKL
jgi:hypothetical protein